MARYASAGVIKYFKHKVNNKRNAKKKRQEEHTKNFRKGFVHSRTGTSERVRSNITIDKHSLPTHGNKRTGLRERLRHNKPQKSKHPYGGFESAK